MRQVGVGWGCTLVELELDELEELDDELELDELVIDELDELELDDELKLDELELELEDE